MLSVLQSNPSTVQLTTRSSTSTVDLDSDDSTTNRDSFSDLDQDFAFIPTQPRVEEKDENKGADEKTDDNGKLHKRNFVLKGVPNAVSKTKDDAVPLPDPFELPKNYRPDVEAALKTGCMTLETNKSFLSTVAASMFVYKKYPTADDYNNVARVIIKMYPFMRSPMCKLFEGNHNLFGLCLECGMHSFIYFYVS